MMDEGESKTDEKNSVIQKKRIKMTIRLWNQLHKVQIGEPLWQGIDYMKICACN